MDTNTKEIRLAYADVQVGIDDIKDFISIDEESANE